MWGLKTKPNVKQEIDRRASQTQRVLTRLKRGGYITNLDLSLIALNYTMRISELRKEGHRILAVYVRPGVYQYIYKGHRDD